MLTGKTIRYPIYERRDDKGVVIKTAQPTGGKAGKGQARTSTVQVIHVQTARLVKQFRFRLDDWKVYTRPTVRPIPM